jgi:hypothetical protein
MPPPETLVPGSRRRTHGIRSGTRPRPGRVLTDNGLVVGGKANARAPTVPAYSRAPRSRSAFVMTVTELRLIAAAATMGERSQPSQG